MIDTILFAKLLSILLNHINEHGKCVDEIVCKELAYYIHSSGIKGYGSTLWEFIYEHGEDEDMDYMGRDEHGEKQYHTYNPKTHWHERIRKELVLLGHYKNQPVEA
jgi:hypothetical protein